MIAPNLVLLSLLVTTFALPSTKTHSNTIPLSRRSGVKRADGTADIQLLKNQVARSLNKFQRGFDAYKKNTGSAHPLAIQSGKALTRRDTGSEPLTEDQGGELWQGSISVGTPPVTFAVDFDTGSSDLFLPGADCTVNCEGHTRYDPAASSSSVNTKKPFKLAFGDNSTVEGTVYTDTVTVAGLTVTGQAVGDSNKYSKGFALDNFPPDGLAGLAFPQISVFGADDLFSTLVSQGVVDEPVFGVKLAADGSEVLLGGVNANLFTGDFTNSPVTKEGFWQIDLQNVDVGNTAVTPSNKVTIVDTGTTLIIADPQEVAAVFAKVRGAKDASDTAGPGFWTVPCNAIPTLKFVFGGTAFPVSPDTLNLGRLSAGSNACVVGLMGLDGVRFWVMGDVFLQNVYTVFDKGNSQVGFAALA